MGQAVSKYAFDTGDGTDRGLPRSRRQRLAWTHRGGSNGSLPANGKSHRQVLRAGCGTATKTGKGFYK